MPRILDRSILFFVCVFALSTASLLADDFQESAKAILREAGIKSGLVVHLGCGDGKLTTALHAGEGFLVHGLDADAGNVDAARSHVRSFGLCGKVSVDRLVGKRFFLQLLGPAMRDPADFGAGIVLRQPKER